MSVMEIAEYELESIMKTGFLPPHFLSQNPDMDLPAYIADYLKEEIVSEALIQNIPAFSEFLRVAALTNSELLNYTNVARETGASAKIIRRYFQILEDTLLGFRLKPWKRVQNPEKLALFTFCRGVCFLTDYGQIHIFKSTA